MPDTLLLSSSGCPRATLASAPLHSLFFNPELLHSSDQLSELVSGLAHQPAPRPAHSFAPSLRGRLFNAGLDLVAINIQRGRDLGLAAYSAYAKLCGAEALPASQQAALATLYSHPGDSDLFIAGLMETPLPGSLLGPTFTCIILDQVLLIAS